MGQDLVGRREERKEGGGGRRGRKDRGGRKIRKEKGDFKEEGNGKGCESMRKREEERVRNRRIGGKGVEERRIGIRGGKEEGKKEKKGRGKKRIKWEMGKRRG